MSDGCAPGKDCCTDCQAHDPEGTERVLLQAGRGFNAGSSLQVLEQGDDIVTWGPASTEAVSEDAKLVRMAAIEQALPAAFDVGTFTFGPHKDQNIARLVPLIPLDPARVPPGPARDLATYLQRKHGGAPTAVLEVTTELVQAFPKELSPHLGRKAFFAGARIRGDTDTKRLIQAEIRRGHLDAYSISSRMTDADSRPICNGDDCKEVLEVKAMDLSAITLGSKFDKTPGPFSGKVRNPGAAFLLLQQASPTLGNPMSGSESLPVVDSPADQPSTPAKPEANPPAAPSVEPEKAAEAVATPTPEEVVEQAEATDPAQPTAPVAPESGDEALSDLRRRMEALEQRMALMPSTPANPEAAVEAAEEPDKPEEAPKEDAKPDKDDVVEQAHKKLIEQATSAAVAAAEKAAEKRFQALLAQAKPADTPNPASPADPGKTREAALLEAARSGDPTKLLEALDLVRTGGKGASGVTT